MILYFRNIRLLAGKHKKPAKDTRKGAKWVQADIFIDAEKITCDFNKGFGNNLYFEYKNISYRISIIGEYYDDIKGVSHYSINPLHKTINLTTKCLLPIGEKLFMSR